MASFEDLFGDVEKVKNKMKGMITRAGTSASPTFDENIIFQYLEEAGAVPDRVQVVFNRINAKEKKETSKKRKRDSSASVEDLSPGGSGSRGGENKAFNNLREMFPHLPVRYLQDRARECSSDGDFQKVVESILTSDSRNTIQDLDDSVMDEAGAASLERSFSNDTTTALDETNLGNVMADTSLPDEEETETPSSQPSHGDYIQRNYQTLLSIFPDVDPEFLQSQSWDVGDDQAKLEAFITKSLEGKTNLPSRKDYAKRKAVRDENHKIKTLKVSDFLEMYEDPHAHFADTSSAVNDLYKKHALYQLRKKYSAVHHSIIEKALEDSNNHFVPASKKIEKMSPKKGKKKQAPVPKRPSDVDLTFLKEYVYSKLEAQIRRHQEKLEARHTKAVEAARKTGGLFDCQCCFDGDCLLTEVAMCEEGHMFCKDCIKRGSGVQIGDQKTQISCLTDCGSTFPLAVLQANLAPTVFSRLLQRRQLEEVQAAGFEDLVQCPACNFATIMPDPLDKIVHCQNPECGKETCRLCREDNHIPLTCDEVEKDSDVADRVKLENAMTDAMLRSCVACQKKFFKEDGCNKMKCSCGATMCYLCRKPVEDNYTHFYGQGSDAVKGKCPLWSDNKNLHRDEVFKAASIAKKALNKKVKYDPTKGIEKAPEGFNPNRLHDIPDGAYDEDESDDDDDDGGNETDEWDGDEDPEDYAAMLRNIMNRQEIERQMRAAVARDHDVIEVEDSSDEEFNDYHGDHGDDDDDEF